MLVLESDLDAQQRGDFIARNQQRLTDKVGEGGLERQSVHVRVQFPLPKERGRELGNGQRDYDLPNKQPVNWFNVIPITICDLPRRTEP